MMQSYLAQEGFRVVTATDGQEGLIDAHHEHPDLILLDLRIKIEHDPRHPRYVETIYGVGYRFASQS